MQSSNSLIYVSLALMLFPLWVSAAEKGQDHPLVGRFEDSEITNYAHKNFDEYKLIAGKITGKAKVDSQPNITRVLEGKITQITYKSPKENSTLEVFRAYQQALTSKNFEILFKCADSDCGGRRFNHASSGYRFSHGAFAENYPDQRYLAAHLPRPGGDIYVAVHTARATSIGGARKNLIYTQVDVIELQGQTSKVVVIKADEMATTIKNQGSVALYGLYFDTDKAIVKSESKPTLDEIGKLLKQNPDLKLLVVGHTDNQGGFDYNIDLSKKRAASVKASLVKQYGIDGKRLKAWGVGYTVPVASNRSEAGRAKNRRVELVADGP